jgi:hypothetical protein
MTAPIAALLRPLKDRLAAATPGPWAHYGDLGHEVYQPGATDMNEPGLVAADIPRLADAALISNAPTDQAKLIAAVEAVEVMHRQDTHYGPYYCICGDKWPCSTVAALTQALGGGTA